MRIDKPKNLEEYDLIAIIGVSDIPATTRGLTDIPYNKSDLAVNTVTQKIQVYVNSATEAGIQEFINDYPNAELRKDDTLSDHTDWRLLAFPHNAIITESPLDSYYKEKHTELSKNI